LQGGAGAALHAVVRPQGLRLRVQQDALEGALARMLAGERGMVGRVPVLCRHHGAVAALRQQIGNRCHQRIALIAGQRTSGHEVRLQVDHQQGDVGGQGGHGRSTTT
jgi:hypothetical protein